MEVSPVDLYLQSGGVVRAVMVILAGASVYGLALIAEKIIVLLRFRGLARQFAEQGAKALAAPRDAPFAVIVQKGLNEAALALDGETATERRARIGKAMRDTVIDHIVAAEARVGNLATIGSVSPFIGLFGTVWGIMHSFMAIAHSNDTSLAVVAPGIAEALSTTAIGLVAAIPASVGYNKLTAAFNALAHRLIRISEALARTISAQEAGR